MGRTAPTLREEFDRLEAEHRPFRRALRRRHQPAFDQLFERARTHADAAAQQNAADPWRAFVLTVLLAQELQVQRLSDDDHDRR
ncbi:hypothetical protein [Halorhabdus salina]|uniref:hypothetical protein n=1 Tax=Halorhabdus salina TaxID=2750670 RepID=UPI0015EFC44F|nr:hypothetical protein [Halorhabdus salina]